MMHSSSDVWAVLCNWLSSQHGWDGAENSVEWRAVQGAGWGLFAARDIKPSGRILSLPPTSLLHVRNLASQALLPLRWFPPVRSSLVPTSGSNGERDVGNGKSGTGKQRRRLEEPPSGGPELGRMTSVQLLSLYLAGHRPRPGGDAASRRNISPWNDYLLCLPATFRPWHPLTWLVPTATDPEDRNGSDMSSKTAWRELAAGLPAGTSKSLRAVHERWEFDLGVMRRALKGLSTKEKARFGWLGEIGEEDMLWGWLNVNTRAIYIDLDIPPLNKADVHPTHLAEQNNLTLCPLLDFANHCHTTKPTACKLELERSDAPLTAPKLRAPRSPWTWANTRLTMLAPSGVGLREGEEVVFAYGSHSDGALFAEYGFVPATGQGSEGPGDPNPWAEVSVEEWFMRLLMGTSEVEAENGVTKRKLLEEKGYWGEYTLNPYPIPAHPDHRFLQALRLHHADIPAAAISKHLGDPTTATVTDRHLESFLSLLEGATDVIDPDVETAVRRSLIGCSETLEAEAQRGLQNVERLRGDFVAGAESEDWAQALDAVTRLWQDQARTAREVAQSIKHGVEF